MYFKSVPFSLEPGAFYPLRVLFTSTEKITCIRAIFFDSFHSIPLKHDDRCMDIYFNYCLPIIMLIRIILNYYPRI